MTFDDGLAEALRSIPGVADAEVDEGDGPNGVRVRLSPDADPAEVAVAVREVLAGRGLRGRLAPGPRPGEADEPIPLPGSDREATVIPGPGWIGRPVAGPPPGGEEAGGEEEVIPVEQLELEEAIEETPAPVAPPPPRASGTAAAGGLVRVTVEEGRETLSVTAEARDGTRATRSARTSPDGFHQAVVGAVAALLDPASPAPRVVAIRDDVVSEGRIITVVLERADGTAMVGSSMVGAERAFALARAAWAALTDAP